MYIFRLEIVIFFTNVLYAAAVSSISKNKRIVVFAFSGLRWDAPKYHQLSSFRELQNTGVHAKRKIDAFQTASLPSFVTMVTGKYPESHGMMANRMKDLSTGEIFDVTNNNLHWWQNVEPIWITNAKNGSTSALCYWPGHDVDFLSNKTIYTCSNQSYADPFKEIVSKGDVISEVMPFEERLLNVKKWLNLRKDSPSFIGVYFEEPLKSIMKYGISSKEANDAFKTVDNITRQMHDYLFQNKMFDDVNFVVTGESGVTEIHEHQEIYLEDYNIDSQMKYEIIDDGPIMTIYPQKDEHRDKLISRWSGIHKHMAIYSGKNLSEEFHFTNEKRTAPILAVADETWRIYHTRIIDGKKGMMGYDGKFASSHSLFLAKGPSFQEHVSLDAIGNVDVYAILCRALNITSHSNSGNTALLEKVMRKEDKWYMKIVKKVTSTTTGLTFAIIGTMVLLFVAMYLVVTAVYKTVGCCVCPKQPLRLKINPFKRLSPTKDKGGHRLLSEEELSSEASDTDDELRQMYDKK